MRWPIQLLALLAYALASWLCWRRFRDPLRPRPYLGPVLVWLVLEVVLAFVLVVRVVHYAGEPPVSISLNWWANTLWLAGAVALSLTFWLSRRSDG